MDAVNVRPLFLVNIKIQMNDLTLIICIGTNEYLQYLIISSFFYDSVSYFKYSGIFDCLFIMSYHYYGGAFIVYFM